MICVLDTLKSKPKNYCSDWKEMKLREFQEDSLDGANLNVQFALDNGVWLNATYVSKQYGKRLDEYWDNHDTKSYVKKLAELSSLDSNDLKQVVVGKGEKQGTYIHPDLVVHFARWVNPEFAYACDKLVSNQHQVNKELFDEIKSFMPTGSYGELNDKNGCAKTKKVRGYYRSDKNDELSKLVGEKTRLVSKLSGFFDEEIKTEIVKIEMKITKLKETIELDKVKRLESKKRKNRKENDNDKKMVKEKHREQDN